MAAACHSRRRTAHPRSRGENQVFDPTADGDDGSSPLTRGKRRTHMPQPCDPRLIPAHAGKTPSPESRAVRCPAHPRSRGENLSRSSAEPRGPGSSPLTRGKHRDAHPRRRQIRLIPAHAGKTPGRSHPPRPPGAHPRSRGENHPPSSTRANTPGSSPLTRGKLTHCGCLSSRVGLIPAHAGKTWVACAYDRGTSAHPRSRGENLINAHMRRCDHGSSPLTRGKLADQGLSLDGLGLIPAHAGKTNRGRQGSLLAGAHPRSRGENV